MEAPPGLSDMPQEVLSMLLEEYSKTATLQVVAKKIRSSTEDEDSSAHKQSSRFYTFRHSYMREFPKNEEVAKRAQLWLCVGKNRHRLIGDRDTQHHHNPRGPRQLQRWVVGLADLQTDLQDFVTLSAP